MSCRNLRVVAGVDPALAFEDAVEVLCAHSADEAPEAFACAERRLSQGAWIAGFLSYELGASFVKLEDRRCDEYDRRNPLPLLCLGVFGEPRKIELAAEGEGGRITPLLYELDRHAYDGALDAIFRRIYEGDAYQINYTLPLAFHAAGDLERIYGICARRCQAPYQASVSVGGYRILSWSPELFLAFDGTRITTKPMKGTAPLDRVADLAGEKNRAELAMIADLLRNDLNKICDGVTVEKLFDVERFPTFAAMTATISGECRPGTSLLDIFRATFPCGSVTGAPKRSAMAIIAELERRPRGVYCGTIGFLSPQRRGWWNVAIRTAHYDCTQGVGRFDAGGAIVADSTAEAEWAEIRLKLRMLDPVIDAEFALLETFASDAGDSTIGAHLRRLERSARAFGFGFDAGRLCVRLRAARDRAGEIVRVRLGMDGSMTIATARKGPPGEKVRICVSDARVWSGDPFLRHKSTWRPAHEAAAKQAEALACFDGLLLNERDELTEGARTNLFIERHGLLWTPPLRSGVLPGILRESLIASGRAREGVVTLDDLASAEAIYVGNSARGLLRCSLRRREPAAALSR